MFKLFDLHHFIILIMHCVLSSSVYSTDTYKRMF